MTIYIVCSDIRLAFDYVRKELGGHPNEHIFWYVAKASDCHDITLRVGDRVHKLSTTNVPMDQDLYMAWEVVERTSGLPTPSEREVISTKSNPIRLPLDKQTPPKQ